MGYSARYHVASLAAVFLALAVGLLLGAEFGDEVVTGTAKNLEQSLKGDLEDAKSDIASLEAELDRESRFADAVYPALAGSTLPDRSIGIVALGGSDDDLRRDIEEALAPTGADIAQLAVVREPPDLDALAELAPGGRSPRSPRAQETLAIQRAGTSLVTGGAFYDRARETLLSSFSGSADPLDGVIVVRDRPELDGDEEEDADRLERDLVDGILRPGVPVVGVERTDADPSSISGFGSYGLTTVNDMDLVAGQVALVYALQGAQGSFGVGETADELVPPLLRRADTTTEP
jgi:hypothetical protein